MTNAPNGADVRCYVIVDPAACAGRDPVDVALAAAWGGATIVQLRDKRGDVPAMLALARRMRNALKGTGVPIVINDRVDVALAAGAHGAHVGQGDLPAEEARALLDRCAERARTPAQSSPSNIAGGWAGVRGGGRSFANDTPILGLSHKTPQEVASSPVAALSYAAIGGIFPTASKEQGASGLQAFARMAAMMRKRAPALPIVGIAGITAQNAGSVIAAGADGVAVISAVCAADDPEAATRALRAAVDAALAERM